MKFEVKSEALKSAVRAVKPAVRGLGYYWHPSVTIQANPEEGLRVYSVGSSLGIARTIPGRVLEPGEAALPVKLISDFVQALPTGVKLSGELDSETLRIRIQGEFYDHRIQCTNFLLGPRAMPAPGADAATFVVSAPELVSAIRQVAVAASIDKNRPVLTGLFLEVKESGAILVATDGYRMAKRPLISVKGAVNAELIIPAPAMRELTRVFKGVQGELRVTFEDNRVWIEGGDSQLHTRQIEGLFPNYQAITLNPPNFRIRQINRLEFSEALQLLAVTLPAATSKEAKREHRRVIKLTVAPNSDTFTIGTCSSSKEITLSAAIDSVAQEGVVVGFNPDYLVDGLEVMSGDRVTLEFENPLGPALIHEPLSLPDFKYILMPMRLPRDQQQRQ